MSDYPEAQECKAEQVFTQDQLEEFLKNSDSLKKYSLDSNTIMATVMPYTYSYFWNTNPEKVNQKLFDGIGFVLTEKDPYIFIDLDDSKGDTEINKKYIEIAMARLKPYLEQTKLGEFEKCA